MTTSKRAEITEWLRARIVDGEWQPGDRLPSERDIGEEFPAASRGTIRQAYNTLIAERLVRAEQGKGYFVADTRLIRVNLALFERSGEPVDAWIEDMEAQGHEAAQHITGVEIVRPQNQIAELLGLTESGVAAVRRRLRFVNDAPFAVADSYFPEDVVRGTPIMLPEDIPTGGRHILAELGYPLEHHVDRLRVRGLTPAESQRLRVPTGTTVFVHTRASGPKGGPNAGRVVRVMVTVMPADRVEIVVDPEGGAAA